MCGFGNAGSIFSVQGGLDHFGDSFLLYSFVPCNPRKPCWLQVEHLSFLMPSLIFIMVVLFEDNHAFLHLIYLLLYNLRDHTSTNGQATFADSELRALFQGHFLDQLDM
jgi:hypothetical protein